MMNRILAFTLAILLVFPVNLAWGQSDEGYGETETALGQFVDSFETSGNVSVAVNVIRNSTLEAMELNFTAVILEDFSTFTEVDPLNHLEQNATTASWEAQIRNEESNIYKDYTAGFFDDFYQQFEHEYTDFEAGDATSNFQNIVWGMSNTFGSFANVWAGTTIVIHTQQNGATDDVVEYRLLARKGGGTTDSDTKPNTPIQKYYIIFNRTGNNIDALFYDDSAHTSLDFKLSITAWGDNLRYAIGTGSRNSGVDPNDHSTGYIKNMNMGGGGFNRDGYFTTVDYLSDPQANGSGLVAMINSSIPGNTDIQLQFSNDNATWGDNQGIPGDSHDLDGGFESIDLRDLNYSTGFYYRFNLSTVDVSITPRVYQSRLITMIGEGAGPGGTINQTLLNGTWVYYNLTAIINQTGVHDAGNLASTYFVDGNSWNCSEVVGAPGYAVKFNATGIDTEAISVWLVAYVYYDGNQAHDIDVQFWNFTSTSWANADHLDDDVGFEWHNVTIYGLRIPNDFINSTGAIIGRFYHADPGNINHDIFIDRISILAFVPTGLAVAGAGANWGLLWFLLILICVPIILVLKKGTGR